MHTVMIGGWVGSELLPALSSSIFVILAPHVQHPAVGKFSYVAHASLRDCREFACLSTSTAGPYC